MSNKKINIITSIASLFLGGAIYILYRENCYVSNFVEGFIPLSFVRDAFNPFECDFIKYYLIDFLWASSLATALSTLFDSKRCIFLTALFVFLLGFVWELLQFFNIISGTGDIADIFMYLTAGLTAVIINFPKIKGEQK